MIVFVTKYKTEDKEEPCVESSPRRIGHMFCSVLGVNIDQS